MFSTIVVGVDGRQGGRDALSLAGRLAAAGGGRLLAVQALPFFDDFVSPVGSPPFTPIAAQATRRLLDEEPATAGVPACTRVLGDSSPARALHRVAQGEGADLIVVGSTHHGGVGRVFAGDDATGTLHGSPCPVAVAPRGLADRQWEPVRRIGVGFDGRPESRQALDFAVALARENDASLLVRAVVATPPPSFDVDVYDERWVRRARRAAAAQVREILTGLDVEARGDTLAGNPVSQLVALSREVDLLVVGSRGWGPVRRILVGSTAAIVTREAHSPVLVLPRGAATGQPGEDEPRSVADARVPRAQAS